MTHPAALATALHAVDNENLGVFGHDPWWLILFKAVIAFAIFVVFTLFNIYFERKVVAWMQMRIGPNRVGPKGILQSLADGVKLPLKEDIVPTAADKVVFVLAPLLSAIPAFMAVAVIPFGPVVSIFHHKTPLQLTDLPVGILYVLAVASIGIYGIVLAGWSSGSTYPLLGGLRSTAQMISYEIAMGLCFAAVFLQAGTMSTSGIVTGQQKIWYGVMLAPSFVVYVISMIGETNRAPFDLPEAEGELVGGFHTEYSSMKFAMFFLAEYVNMVTVSALAVTMFLGGWRAPWPITTFWAGANHGWFPMIWFIGKLLGFIFFFVWLRGTLPRLRYDQFMKLGWKVLIPFSILWLLAVATIKLLRDRGDLSWSHIAPIGVVVAVILIALLGLAEVAERRQNRAAEEAAAAAPQEFDPMAGGFPVPPMPGQVLPAYVPRARRPALVGAVEPDETPDETSTPEEGSDV